MHIKRGVFALVALLCLLSSALVGQGFRGAIAGSVADSSGAGVPDAVVKIEHKATGLTRTQNTGASGDFNFPELSTGIYTVSVSKQGFQAYSQDIEVAVGKVASLPVTLGVAAQAQTVEVQAAVATLETQDSTLNAVVNTRAVQEIPLNGRDFTQLLRLTPGYNDTGSMNGARGNQNNWQIDGADNNDFWHNSNGINQGSISGVAGVILPIDAIDQFNQQAGASADGGRSPGSLVNVVLKSGTNSLHGTAYYFNRNEALAAHNPFAPPDQGNPLLRNENFGFSLGGPIIKNKLFFFMTYERQKAVLGQTVSATVPSAAWISQATTVLNQFHVPVNPVMQNVFNALWPSNISGLPATNLNYFISSPQNYESNNGVFKLDYSISSKHTLSARMFLGEGDATAFAGSVYSEYFQVCPSRQPNYAVQLNSVFTPKLVNQLLLGFSFFQQKFDDANHSFDMPALGLNTGVTNPSSFGAPTFTINGFTNGGVGQTNATLGRTDTTGHLTDNLSYQMGKHALKFGGEYRLSRLDIFYQRGLRGAFNFDGTAGPWNGDASIATPTKALADFLAGIIGPAGTNNGASISVGDPQRVYDVTTLSGWVTDNWQVSPKLNLTLGVRYDYNGPIHETTYDNEAGIKGISTFLPGSATGFGIVGVGGFDQLYPSDKNNFAPRIGFAYTPIRGGKTVIRGGFGIFTDIINGNNFIDGAGGGERGISRNPVGANPVLGATAGGFTIQNGVPIFGAGSLPSGPFQAFGISQDIRTPYTENFNLNVQHQLTRAVLIQVGYVGTQARKQVTKRNINQTLPDPTGQLTIQERRPFNTEYPNLSGISWLETAGNLQYNSLQTSLRTTSWHGVTGQASYVLSHARDDMSSSRYNEPQDSYCLKCDYGNSDYDIRHVFSSYLLYDLPNFAPSHPRLGQGWQTNLIFIARTGTPFSVFSGQNTSNLNGGGDRASLVAGADPFSGVVQPTNADGNYANGYRWFNPAAFTLPAQGTLGNTERNQFYAPGFNSVDFSIFKTTAITERIKAQFRVEIFNLFNRVNFAGPNNSVGSGSSMGLVGSTYGAAIGAPGIGAGEPRNVQLALKIVF